MCRLLFLKNKSGKCSVIIYLNIHTLFEYIYIYIYSPLSPLSSGSYIFDYVDALNGAHFCLWLLSFFFILFSLCSSSCIISINLSSISLYFSYANSNLLLKHCSEYFISAILFYSRIFIWPFKKILSLCQYSLMQHCHHNFIYFISHSFLWFCERIYDGYSEISFLLMWHLGTLAGSFCCLLHFLV